MKRMVMAGPVLCGVLVLTAGAQRLSTQGAQTPEALLGAAIHQEEAEGNLEDGLGQPVHAHGDNHRFAVGTQREQVVPESNGRFDRFVSFTGWHDQQVGVDVRRPQAFGHLSGVRGLDVLVCNYHRV